MPIVVALFAPIETVPSLGLTNFSYAEFFKAEILEYFDGQATGKTEVKVGQVGRSGRAKGEGHLPLLVLTVCAGSVALKLTVEEMNPRRKGTSEGPLERRKQA